MEAHPARAQVLQQGHGVPAGAAGVNRQGQVQVQRQPHEAREDRVLAVPDRVVGGDPVVDAHLPDGDHLVAVLPDQGLGLIGHGVIEVRGVVAQGGEHRVVAVCQGKDPAIVLGGLTDADHPGDAGLPRPPQHLVQVRLEVLAREVTVYVV